MQRNAEIMNPQERKKLIRRKDQISRRLEELGRRATAEDLEQLEAKLVEELEDIDEILDDDDDDDYEVDDDDEEEDDEDDD